MCWAACDRLALIARTLGLAAEEEYWRQRAGTMRRAILAAAWDERHRSFVTTFGGDAVDASLLLLPSLGVVTATDAPFLATLTRIERELLRDGYVYRYVDSDDLGVPTTAFIVCSFWYAEALAMVGRRDEAPRSIRRAARAPQFGSGSPRISIPGRRGWSFLTSRNIGLVSCHNMQY